jgi:hypothetical protein
MAGVGCRSASEKAEGSSMNTLVFVGLVMAAEAWIVWLAYCMGVNNGWLDAMDRRPRD